MKGVYVTVLIVLVCTSLAFCKDYYVDSINGDPEDPGSNGTIEKPWAAISYALSQVAPTESDPAIIHIAEGRYDRSNEDFPILLKSFVSLVGADRETTIIDGGNTPGKSIFNCSASFNISLEGMTFTGGTGSLTDSC